MSITQNRRHIERHVGRCIEDEDITQLLVQLVGDDGPGLSLECYAREKLESPESLVQAIEERCSVETDQAARASSFRLLAIPADGERAKFSSPRITYQVAHGTGEAPAFEGATTATGVLRMSSTAWETQSHMGNIMLGKIVGMIAPPTSVAHDDHLDRLRRKVIDQVVANTDQTADREERLEEAAGEMEDRRQIAERTAKHVPLLMQSIAAKFTDGRIPKPSPEQVRAATLDVNSAMMVKADNYLARAQGQEPKTEDDRHREFHERFHAWLEKHFKLLLQILGDGVAAVGDPEELTDHPGYPKLEALVEILEKTPSSENLQPKLLGWAESQGFSMASLGAALGAEPMTELVTLIQEAG